MTDNELRAHDLAVVFTRNLHLDLSNQLDSSTLEVLCERFLADYESSYEYFKSHISNG